MDVQAERRFQQLKKRLDALHYCQPLTIESAALAEKLLNDLLKTTEGFQKLKKLNEEQKSQISNDQIYLEPLKKENERIVRENNELHLQMIKVREECEMRENQMRAQLRQIQNEKTDLQFLSNQKDFKLQELERTVSDMKAKLDKALQKAFNPAANDVVKGLRKEINQQDNVLGRKQEFTLSRPIDSQNVDPNKASSIDMHSQQQVWAEELRKADQRALLYKKDIDGLDNARNEAEKKIKELIHQIDARDQEIHRLSLLYRGGQNFETVKTNFDKQKNEELVGKIQRDNEFLNQENHRLELEIQEIKELLGICETKDPTDKDRAHLKKLVRELKTRNDQMTRELKQMEEVVSQLKGGKLKEVKVTNQEQDEEIQRLRRQVQDAEFKIQDLQKENSKLRVDTDKVQQYQSAYTSNTKAFQENLENLTKETREKDDRLQSITQENQQLQVEISKLKEDLNLYKGKCANLTRDVELSQTYLSKVGQDSFQNTDQFNYFKDRVRVLESDLESAFREKTDAIFETQRLQSQLNALEKQISEQRLHQLKLQGDTSTSLSAMQRIQSQLQSKQIENEVLLRTKEDLEKLVRQNKNELLESERKANDYYQQLLRSNENFQILQNEQKLLSQELTQKQQEQMKLERERLQLERELLQLRPLKSQLENFSQNTQKTIEENVRNEYEKSKYASRCMELQNDLDVARNELGDLNAKQTHLLSQNSKLIEQLKIFEKESFEIQNKIRRGFEVERENENITKTVDQYRQIERDLNKQVDDLKSQIRQRDQEIDRLKSRTDNASYYSKTLEQDTQQLRNENISLNEQLSQHKTELIRQQQQKNQNEIEVIDLRRASQILKDEKTRAENDLASVKKELDEERNKNKALQQQSDRLRAMVENLDSTREQLVKRLQSTSSEKQMEEQDKAVLLNDIQQYKRELTLREQEIEDLRKSIEQLDRNVDELQQELDVKTEELVGAKMLLEKQTRDFGNIQHHMTVATSKEDNLQRRLFEREGEIKQLKVEIEHLRQQLEEQTQFGQVKSQECQELLEDIQTLTRENKYVSTEFTKSAQANEYLRKQNEDLVERERLAQQSLRALEMEKADILTNYRNACFENERLQETVAHVSHDNKDVYSRGQSMEKDLITVQHRLREKEQRERQYIDEIHQLERHIDNVTIQLEAAHNSLREAQVEKENMINDFHQQRNLSYSLEMSSQDVHRQISMVEGQKQQVQLQLRDLQKENDIMRKQIEMERERYGELERAFMQESQIMTQKDYQIQMLEKDILELQTENERHKLRIQSLQNHIDSLQRFGGGRGASSETSQMDHSYTRVLELEDQVRASQNDLEDLRKENEKLKVYLNKYESQIQDLENELHNLR